MIGQLFNVNRRRIFAWKILKNKTSSKRAQEKESVYQKHKSSYESKITHGRFKGVKDQIRGDATCDWLKKEYLKKRN